ncbi:unnamed protein product [Bemisia tabaci]|uniref:NADH dehydrogenase [ubiquinone] 1 alpha subcomplex subunit 9, mitochondrial n=1 Tax=Bemisia tabaci TaxID=7038 RepID=A0A9P0AJ06_BEMTA|nr:unnamed protein product [Bemisia tabaci]
MTALALNSVPQLLRAQAGPAISVAFYSDGKKIVLPSALKKGTGGRSSFNGIVATVFGANGFLGRVLCNRLGKVGTQLIIPFRCDAYNVRNLKLAGDLGQVLFQEEFDVRDEIAIYNALKYSNVVINLIGCDWETRNFKYRDVHVDAARRIARIAKETGVPRLIHVSSLNVAEKPQRAFLKNGSEFLKTKWEGEHAVLEEFPEATIFRPANIYGQDDSFLSHFQCLPRRTGKVLSLWKKGEETIKQPVYVGDVAQAIANAAQDPSSAGKIYQAVGPKRYYMSDLMDWTYWVMRRDPDIWGYRRWDLRFDPTVWARLWFFGRLYGNPVGHMITDKIERDSISDVIDKSLPTLEDLDIKLTDYELQVPWEVRPFRAFLYYDETPGEWPERSLPTVENA